jgi:hypothetical protein
MQKSESSLHKLLSKKHYHYIMIICKINNLSNKKKENCQFQKKTKQKFGNYAFK